jgi:hypothetical protein
MMSPSAPDHGEIIEPSGQPWRTTSSARTDFGISDERIKTENAACNRIKTVERPFGGDGMREFPHYVH